MPTFDLRCSFKGTEPSPRGKGYCAHNTSIGSTMRGTDGNMWIVKEDVLGRHVWKRTDNDTEANYIHKRSHGKGMVQTTWSRGNVMSGLATPEGLIGLYKKHRGTPRKSSPPKRRKSSSNKAKRPSKKRKSSSKKRKSPSKHKSSRKRKPLTKKTSKGKKPSSRKQKRKPSAKRPKSKTASNGKRGKRR